MRTDGELPEWGLYSPLSRRSKAWNIRSAARSSSSSGGEACGRVAARRSNSSRTSWRSSCGSASKDCSTLRAVSPIDGWCSVCICCDSTHSELGALDVEIGLDDALYDPRVHASGPVHDEVAERDDSPIVKMLPGFRWHTAAISLVPPGLGSMDSRDSRASPDRPDSRAWPRALPGG